MLPLYRNIRKLREEKGISQQELAEQTGYTSRSSIAKIEDGKIDLPQSKIVLFAKALHTTPEKLMGWSHTDTLFGNDISNREFLANQPELLSLYTELLNREDIAILFDKTKDLEPKDVESVLLFVQTIRNQRGID